ncbi:MAG TPA: nucleotide exchange factor GrpE [Candidatus Blautia merdipullorum]|nr:nucleotide exchange factor GrpE [Candidatus Blautia merdipullorum]
MAEEKREFNPIDEETVSEGQAEEIIKEDDEKAAEEAGEEEIKKEAEEEDASGAEEQDEQKEPEKKGFFKKKKDKKDEKIEELTDMVKRQMAEFDNYRKRTEKEKASMYEIGAREVIEKILPIVDNFERGLAAVPEEEKETPFVDGMNKIYRQLLSVFEGMGVKAIESVGQEFNPDYHNAVMHVEDEEAGENVVVEEFQKGYTYKDTVIRHSMVKVAN